MVENSIYQCTLWRAFRQIVLYFHSVVAFLRRPYILGYTNFLKHDVNPTTPPAQHHFFSRNSIQIQLKIYPHLLISPPHTILLYISFFVPFLGTSCTSSPGWETSSGSFSLETYTEFSEKFLSRQHTSQPAHIHSKWTTGEPEGM